MTEQQKRAADVSLGFIISALKHLAAGVVAISAIGTALWWLFEPRLMAILDAEIGKVLESTPHHRGGGVCATVPQFGHEIEDGRPGEWVEVIWRDVVRHRADCGTPVVHATIENGGDILHSAELSISGVAVPPGQQDFRYLVKIPENVHPGSGRLWVSVDFPDAIGGAPTAFSPRWPFNILE